METLLFGYWSRRRAMATTGRAAHSFRAAKCFVFVIAVLGCFRPALGDDAAADTTPAPICDELNECLAIVEEVGQCDGECPQKFWAVEAAMLKIGAPAIPGLIKLANDDRHYVRYIAGLILGGIDGLRESDLPALIAANRRDHSVATAAIARIGTEEAVRYLVQQMRIHSSLVAELGRDSVPYLLELFRCDPSCNSDYFKTAGLALAGMGDDASAAVQPLAAIASDPTLKFSLRKGAIKALGSMGRVAQDAIPSLVAIAADEHENSTIRHIAITELGAMGQAASGAVPVLHQLAEGNNGFIAKSALAAIENIGDPYAIPSMLARLERESGFKRESAILAFASMGTNAMGAAPVLRGLLDDPDWEIRVHAAEVLGWIGDRAAIPVLMTATRSADWKLVYAAAESLGMLRAEEARARLTDIADTHWFPFVQKSAKTALEKVAAVPSGTQLGEPPDVGSIYRKHEIFLATLPTCELGQAQWHDKWITVPGLKWRESFTYNLPPGEGSLTGVNMGEWGGKLIHRAAGGTEREIYKDNIVDIVDTNAGLLAIAGLSHLGMEHGSFVRISKGNEGLWSASPLVILPGDPFRRLLTSEKELLLMGTKWAVALNAKGELEWLPCR